MTDSNENPQQTPQQNPQQPKAEKSEEGFFSAVKKIVKRRAIETIKFSISNSKINKNPSISKAEDNGPGAAYFAVILVILFHLTDAYFTGLMAIDNTLPVKIMMYTVLAFAVFYLLNGYYEGNYAGHAIKTYSILTVLSIGLYPFLAWIFTILPLSEYVSFLSVAALILPPWYVYLTYFEGIKVPLLTNAIRTIYIGLLFLLIVPAALMAGGSVQELGVDVEAVNPSIPFTILKEFMLEETQRIKETFESSISSGRTQFDRRLNETLGIGYHGEIERARDQTGVFIQNFNSLSTTFYEDERAVFLGVLRARSFSMDEVDIKLSCEAIPRSGSRISGKVITPANDNIVTISTNAQIPIRCEFEPNQLTPGRHEIRMYADFDFETTSSTIHYFVGADIIESLRTPGRATTPSWNSIMRISSTPNTIFTGGPVSIGMDNSAEMPIEVFSNADTVFPIRYGVQNLNLQLGEIQQIHNFTIKLPQTISLDSCTPNTAESRNINDIIQGFKAYTINFQAEPGRPTRVAEIMCFARIREADANNFISGSLQSIEPSIIGQAVYTYKLRATTNILINQRDTPLT